MTPYITIKYEMRLFFFILLLWLINNNTLQAKIFVYIIWLSNQLLLILINHALTSSTSFLYSLLKILATSCPLALIGSLFTEHHLNFLILSTVFLITLILQGYCFCQLHKDLRLLLGYALFMQTSSIIYSQILGLNTSCICHSQSR